MKAMFTIIWKKLIGLFLGILGVTKRLICRIRRSRRNSGSLLPVANHVPITPDVTQSVPSNEVELEDWDSWGADQPIGVSVLPDHPGNQTANHHLGSQTANNCSHLHNNVIPTEPEQEPDYFQEMIPELKRPKKILVKKKEKTPQNTGLSTRLAFNTDVLPVNNELGTWDDDNAWEGDVDEDLTWQAEAAIKEKRRQDRQQRQAEQQRKKQEKEMQRLKGKDSGTVLAVKLS